MTRRRLRGLTLIELMVTLAIVVLLILAAAPSFTMAFVNSGIRGTGEAILSGIQLARSEAVSRNARVRFQLTDTLDGSCALSTAGRNWVINLDPNANLNEVEGLCDSAPYDDSLPLADQDPPYILQTRPTVGRGDTLLAASQASLVFNGVGRLAEIPAGNVTIDISNPAAGDCAEEGGEVSCLRIVVSPAGQARMCNPARAAGDPQACLP
jgi:type IV fimbrial biogenesis protein FimT